MRCRRGASRAGRAGDARFRAGRDSIAASLIRLRRRMGVAALSAPVPHLPLPRPVPAQGHTAPCGPVFRRERGSGPGAAPQGRTVAPLWNPGRFAADRCALPGRMPRRRWEALLGGHAAGQGGAAGSDGGAAGPPWPDRPPQGGSATRCPRGCGAYARRPGRTGTRMAPGSDAGHALGTGRSRTSRDRPGPSWGPPCRPGATASRPVPPLSAAR